MDKCLLILGAGFEQIKSYQIAKELGLQIVGTDINPLAQSFKFADYKIIASTYDIKSTIEATLKFHKTVRPINGVICVGTDITLTMASVADALNLPSISIETATLATDKLAMKQKLAADDIPVPWFSKIESVDQLNNIISNSEKHFVLKPIDSRGSRGVIRLTQDINTDWAFQESLKYSPSRCLILEEFLPGPQVSTESIVVDGVAYTSGFADRSYEFLDIYAPFFIENGGDLPSNLPLDQQKTILNLMQRGADCIGVKNGIVKGDIVVHDGVPKIIELATRLSGGFFCTHLIPLNCGVDLVTAAIKMAMGETISIEDIKPKFNRYVSQRWIFPTPGNIVSIQGIEEARRIEGIREILISAKIGDKVEPPQNSNASIGSIIATGESREQALAIVKQALRIIKVETKL